MTKNSLITIGQVKVTPIFEIEAGEDIQGMISNATPENIQEIDWLQPYYADKNGKLKAQVQSFVIETSSKIIIVDTCVGNGKNRSGCMTWDKLDTNFLDNLQAAGYPAEAIDTVVCTHLHFDHVGWNTKKVGEKWLPTFPNARYVIVEDEYNYWAANPNKEMPDDCRGITDSVRPVVDAGLVDFVSDSYQITDEISLFPTPGHTPHHVSVVIKSEDRSAVITGDILHHPCQIAQPEWMSFDTEENQALATRIEFLERFANTEAIIIGTHFAHPAAGRIVKEGTSFRFLTLGK